MDMPTASVLNSRVDLPRTWNGSWLADAEFVIIGREEITVLREIAMPAWLRKNSEFERQYSIHVVAAERLVPVVLRISSKNGKKQALVMEVDEDGEIIGTYRPSPRLQIIIDF